MRNGINGTCRKHKDLENGESYAHEALMGRISRSESLNQRYHTHLIVNALLCDQELDIVRQKLDLKHVVT